MNTMKILKNIGFIVTGIGLLGGIISDLVDEKKQELIIEQKVNEALAKRDEGVE